MKIIYPLYVTVFDVLSRENNKEAKAAGEEMLCTTLYLENSDKARFDDLKKRLENNYVLNKAEYPRTVTVVHSLILNYQPDYNYNGQPQSQGVNN